MSSVTAAGDAGTTHAGPACHPALPPVAASAVVPAQLRSLRSSPHTHTHTHTHSSDQPWIERDAKRAARLMTPVTCLVTLRSPYQGFSTIEKQLRLSSYGLDQFRQWISTPDAKYFFQLVCPPPLQALWPMQLRMLNTELRGPSNCSVDKNSDSYVTEYEILSRQESLKANTSCYSFILTELGKTYSRIRQFAEADASHCP